MVSETKLDDSLSTRQFLIKGFRATYRLDGDGSSDGTLIYVREDNSSKWIATDFSNRVGFL